MLADASVVVDGDGQSRVGVALVGNPIGVLGVVEAGDGVRAVAPRLAVRLSATAQRRLRPGRYRVAQPVGHPFDVGEQIRAVLDDLGLMQ